MWCVSGKQNVGIICLCLLLWETCVTLCTYHHHQPITVHCWLSTMGGWWQELDVRNWESSQVVCNWRGIACMFTINTTLKYLPVSIINYQKRKKCTYIAINFWLHSAGVVVECSISAIYTSLTIYARILQCIALNYINRWTTFQILFIVTESYTLVAHIVFYFILLALDIHVIIRYGKQQLSQFIHKHPLL